MQCQFILQCHLVSENIGFIYPSSGLFDPRSGKNTQPLQGFSTA